MQGRRFAALALAIAFAGCGDARQADDGPATGWPAPNADLANTRHVAGPIDRASVARLRVAWRRDIGPFASTPVVVDGVVYAQDLQSNVFAIDLESGRLRWEQRYELLDLGPNGVTVGDGRVYGATTLFAFA